MKEFLINQSFLASVVDALTTPLAVKYSFRCKVHLDYLDFCLINTIAFENNILSVGLRLKYNKTTELIPCLILYITFPI